VRREKIRGNANGAIPSVVKLDRDDAPAALIAAHVGAAHVGAAHVGAAHVGAAHVGAAKDRAAKDQAAKDRAARSGPGKSPASKQQAAKRRTRKWSRADEPANGHALGVAHALGGAGESIAASEDLPPPMAEDLAEADLVFEGDPALEVAAAQQMPDEPPADDRLADNRPADEAPQVKALKDAPEPGPEAFVHAAEPAPPAAEDVPADAVAAAAEPESVGEAEPESVDEAEPESVDEPDPAEDAAFVEAIYLAVNPDAAEAVREGRYASGREHWRRVGRAEYARGLRPAILDGRNYGPRPLAATADADDGGEFDAAGYLFLNADVRQALGSDPHAAAQHWLQYGRLEGRVRAGYAPFRKRSATPGEVMARPFGVNVYGPFAATSGLGTAARNTVRALQEVGIPVELWNFDSSQGYLRVAECDRARAPRYRINLLIANADAVERLFEAMPAGQFDSAYNIAIWQWELASFRPDWFTAFGGVDEVWTNSEFQVTAIAASAPVPVVKIYLPVQAPAVRRPASRDAFGLPADKFIFLCAFDIGSTSLRKNPFATIETFAKTFAPNENVFLVLKYHSIRYEPTFIAQLNRTIRGMPNVLVIADELSEVEMQTLRELCDCLVSAHRSEGFGLNIAEFMALGKPVVATNYSGNLDFMDAESAFPVDYTLTEIEQWAGPYGRGYVWADPDRDSLAAQMRRVFDDRAEAERRGRRAAERLAADFSFAAVGRTIAERFRAINLDAKPVKFLEWMGRSATRAVFTSRVADETPRYITTPRLTRQPLLSIVMPVYNVPGDLLEKCIRSVLNQSYPSWEICICDDGSRRADTLAVLAKYRGISPKIKIRGLNRNGGISGASNAAAEMAVGDYIVLLDNDDELDQDALWEVAAAINEDPERDCIYSDEYKIDMDGRLIDHFFKPDWSPEHLESVMYVLHMFVIRKQLFHQLRGFRSAFDGAQDYDLMLRCSRVTDRIHHIRKPLYHWRAIPGSSADQVDAKPTALTAGLRALQDHATAKYGTSARAVEGLTAGTFRVERPLPGRPRVSLLILTNNSVAELPGRGSICLVENFVNSIQAHTDYPNYEIVVVDNDSLSSEQVRKFRKLGVRVENFVTGGRPFNFAAKANFAVGCVRTEHLVLLNDDMEIIRPGWLTALLQLSCDPEIGGVGARLLHFDGTIQHVGVALGVNSSVAHLYHSFPGDMIGYNAFTHVIRNFSAVTAACFATRRSVLAQVGGFDEAFAVDFNDIDLCLRMRKAGYRIAYTPYAELYHFEGASAQRKAQDPAEVRLFAERWADIIADDPYYNPNLARDRLDYACRDWAPRLVAAAE
jgi:GT2 family glycosyltransferase/glycosyltransferase involved in cell wall biosynthesis